jgi:glycosyltransferase involved in cell wall biosynthesis
MKELTVLMPCLNEVETIGICIKRAKKLLEDNGIDGEILVSDNGSTDGSQEVARSLGAKVVECPVRGYGAALQYGIENAEGKYVLMGDSDDSYHFEEAMPIIECLRSGYDLCMGSRLKGKIMPNAMPLLNRYLGNPILTTIGRLFFKIKLSDFHCGMRAFKREKILGLDLVTTGMEWASEMIIKAKLAGLRMTDIPITLYKDGRSRSSHLKRWHDGWRHLRFMLLHSPKWLFIIPGLAMITVGIVGIMILMPGMFKVGRAYLDVHSLLVAAFMVILGTQTIFTGIFANLYSHVVGILPYDEKFYKFIRRFTLERLLLMSLIIGVIGISGLFYTIWDWYSKNFSELNYQITMRQLIPSLTMIALSFQGIFNGFMLSILFLKVRPKTQFNITPNSSVKDVIASETKQSRLFN